MGLPRAVTIDTIRSIVEGTGAKLISTSYVNNHSPMEFLCSKCGAPWKFTWKKYSKGQNVNFLCGDCCKESLKSHLRNLKKGYSIDQIRLEFSAKGAELISTEYINEYDDIWFKCSKCGDPWHIKMSVYKRGNNQELLCQSCYMKKQGKQKLYYKDVKKFFKENGSELYSKDFKSINQIIEYRCINCGEIGKYKYSTLMQREGERRFYCKDCVRGYRLNPNGNYGGEKGHHIYDLKWFDYVYKFFNLTKEQTRVYSAHHINRFSLFPDYRTSLCNGYPIKIKYHDLGGVDPITGLKNPFHVVNGYLKASEFPEYVKLPYHNYSGFKFLDLNDKLVTEIIAPIDNVDKNYLIDRFIFFKRQGLLYLPFFFDELFVDRRLSIACSLVRRLLYKWFPDIYKYTGQKYNIVFSENLEIKSVESIQANIFCKVNSLSGCVYSDYYIGAYNNGELVMLLPYNYKDNVCVIFGCIEKLNTVVIGGFEKLIDNLLLLHNILSVTYIQDFRFPFFIENLISKGFTLKYVTEPNEFYMHKDTNRFFKSLNNSASWLNTKIDLGLSLKINNGDSEYIKVYDLGDSVYGWEKT